MYLLRTQIFITGKNVWI